ncbi:MAG: HTH-type transcriptional regulator BetI [Syntrophomonadaceae bacterium]|nr:HTH-type transcriptional regulator BetI [Bacillota bacterium]
MSVKLTKGDITRQRLLGAAEEIFGRKGYYNATVVEITMRAEVAQGTFYVYFQSKLDIYCDLVRQLTHEVRREIQKRVTGLENRLDIEREGFRAFFDYVHENRNLYRIIREAEFVENELFIDHYRTIAKGYIAGLQKAMAKKQIRALDPETVAYCLMGMGEFMGMRWVLWENKTPPAKGFEAMMDFIYYGIAPAKGD